MLNGKLGLAPVSRPNRVLDLATGTGIWAIEYGALSDISIKFKSLWPVLTLHSSRKPRVNSNRHRSLTHSTALVRSLLHLPFPSLRTKQPLTTRSVPPNCRFEVDDAENEWTFSESFDYIRRYWGTPLFPSSDFPTLFHDFPRDLSSKTIQFNQ